MNTRQLLKLGVPQDCLQEAFAALRNLTQAGNLKGKSAKKRLATVLEDPSAFVTDEHQHRHTVFTNDTGYTECAGFGSVHARNGIGGVHSGTPWGSTSYRETDQQARPLLGNDTHTHTVTGGDQETRPKNAYVNYIIKY